MTARQQLTVLSRGAVVLQAILPFDVGAVIRNRYVIDKDRFIGYNYGRKD